MKIKYLAHSCFLITSDAGTKIITDPYTTGGQTRFNYGEVGESADLVTLSHGHGDHNNPGAVTGNPKILNEATTAKVKDVTVKGVVAYHDDANGAQKGKNIVFCFTVDGVNVCHLGDLGHQLTDAQVAEIGKVDVLMVPVGGFFTIDAATAAQVCDKVKPKAVIPMHFKTAKAPTLPIADVEGFLVNKKNVTRVDGSEVEFKAGKLPASMQIFALKPAR